ncbi:NACHT, LRR and PYD domains-containing protein 12-like [Mustelus asterias]
MAPAAMGDNWRQVKKYWLKNYAKVPAGFLKYSEGRYMTNVLDDEAACIAHSCAHTHKVINLMAILVLLRGKCDLSSCTTRYLVAMAAGDLMVIIFEIILRRFTFYYYPRLFRNEVGDSGVKLLSAALRNPECKIQKLDLCINDLTDSCAEDLASALSTNRSLIDLNLGVNKLGDSGVKLLSVALRNPDCKIQELHLRGNDLTDSCAEDLASALSTNRSLIDLDLSENYLGDSGVKLLSVALRNPDCKIQKLRLDNNALSDSCAEDLASALCTKQPLRFLSLGTNSFTDQSVPALRRLILTCSSLEEICWGKCCHQQLACTRANGLALDSALHGSCSPFIGSMSLLILATDPKWVDIHSVHPATTAVTGEKLHTFSKHRIPEVLISDNGTSLFQPGLHQVHEVE